MSVGRLVRLSVHLLFFFRPCPCLLLNDFSFVLAFFFLSLLIPFFFLLPFKPTLSFVFSLTLNMEGGSPVINLRNPEVVKEAMKVEFSLRFSDAENRDVEAAQLDSALPADPFPPLRVNWKYHKS